MEEPLKQLLTLGRGYFEKKQYAQAEQYLAKVVEQHPTFADVFNMLGIIYHDQGQFARAQRAFESALKLNPAYTEAALNLAVIYNDMGKYAEAKEVYQAALAQQKSGPDELDPYVEKKIANMYGEIGDVFASSGVWAKAIEEYRRALALCPQFVDIRLKLGNALRDAGDNEAAIREYEQVIAQKPGFIPGHIQYGVALYSAGRRAEAVQVWEEVLALSPGNKSAQMYLNLVKDPGKAEQAG